MKLNNKQRKLKNK